MMMMMMMMMLMLMVVMMMIMMRVCASWTAQLRAMGRTGVAAGGHCERPCESGEQVSGLARVGCLTTERARLHDDNDDDDDDDDDGDDDD
eukprot:4578374-Karenia_brevis.AAC.1